MTDGKKEKGFFDALGDAVGDFAKKRLDAMVPAPAQKLAGELVQNIAKPSAAEPDTAAQGTPAAKPQSSAETALQSAFQTGKTAGEAAKKAADGFAADGKAIVGKVVGAAEAGLAAIENDRANARTTASMDALRKSERGMVPAPSAPPAVAAPAQAASAPAQDAAAAKALADAKIVAEKAIEPLKKILGTDGVPAKSAPAAKPDEPAPDLGANATKGSGQEFNPKHKKPDAKGEVVITKKDGGGVNVQTSTESVYERAMKAVQARELKEPSKFEALSAAIEVAAQATPNAKPAGKGQAK